MSATRFRQIDVTRALRAAKAAGLAVSSVTIDADGRIVIRTDAASGEQRLTPLDKWMAEHAHQA